jgi:hypothetical protein
VEAYLRGRVFRVSILRLFTVFSILIWDGWLTAKDLVGLQPDKIANIKPGAEVFR